MRFKYFRIILLLLLFTNSAFAAIDPQDIYDKKIATIIEVSATAKNIAQPTDVNMAIGTGCFMSAQIYIKLMISSIGEKKLTSIGLPSEQEENVNLDKVVALINKQKKNYRNDEEYMSKVKPYNPDFRKYFFDDIGNNQVRPNNKRVIAWINACNSLVEVSSRN